MIWPSVQEHHSSCGRPKLKPLQTTRQMWSWEAKARSMATVLAGRSIFAGNQGRGEAERATAHGKLRSMW